MLLEARGEFADAADHYAAALEGGRDAPAVLYRLGTAASAAGDLARARDCFERLLARGVRHPDLFAELGKVYDRQNEPALAAQLRARQEAPS
jgi:tetratricopeptide (TPR) repeat protein